MLDLVEEGIVTEQLEEFALPAIVEYAADVLDGLHRIVRYDQLECEAVVGVDEERHLLRLAPAVELGLSHLRETVEIVLQRCAVLLQRGILHLRGLAAIHQDDMFLEYCGERGVRVIEALGKGAQRNGEGQ